MLVLTRQKNKSLVIDTGYERITVVFLRHGGRGAVLGIDAPDHVAIRREELQERLDLRSERHGRRTTEGGAA